MDTSRKSGSDAGSDGERPARRMRTLEEKRKIVAEAMQPGVSVAAVARRHGVNANLLFGWCRLHRRALLDPAGAATPALLPVKITEPTLTPTRRSTPAVKSSSRGGAKSATASGSSVEVYVGEQLRIRLEGAAQREVLERLLAWLPAR